MPLKGTVSERISEFHSGPTYARTKAKFGAARANKQAEAVAFSSARKSNGKGTPMAKTKSYGHDGGDGMAGEKGMSPRKAMASGMMHGGSFGTESLESMSAGQHPDHAAHTGMRPHLQDHERATPPAIHHTKHHLPAQAAPHHGPHHPGGHGLHHTREPNA